MAEYTNTPYKTTKFPQLKDEYLISDGSNKMIFARDFPFDNLVKIKTMTTKTSDIFLISYLRSGTTMMQRILFTLKNGDANMFKDSNFEMDPLFPFLEYKSPTHNGFDSAENQMNSKYRLIKTHLPYWLAPSNMQGKKVFITRDVKDVFVSNYHFRRSFEKEADMLQIETYKEMFMSGSVVYGDWFEWHRKWLDVTDNQSLWVTYEDLITNFDETIRKIAMFINVDLTGSLLIDVKESINIDRMRESLKNSPVKGNFVRKGIIGDYANFLNEEEIKTLNEKTKNIVPELYKQV